MNNENYEILTGKVRIEHYYKNGWRRRLEEIPISEVPGGSSKSAVKYYAAMKRGTYFEVQEDELIRVSFVSVPSTYKVVKSNVDFELVK